MVIRTTSISKKIAPIISDLARGNFPTLQKATFPTLHLLAENRVFFGSTLFLPPTTALAEKSQKSLARFQVIRNFFGDAPELVQRETPRWYLIEKETRESSFHLEDRHTNIHTGALLGEEHGSALENLVNLERIAQFRNPDTEIYQFLKSHPQIASFSFHLGAASEEVENASDENGRKKCPGDIHWVAASPVLSRDIVRARIVDCLTNFRRIARGFGFQGQLMVETLDYHEDDGVSAYAYVTEPDFVKEILDATGYDLLLDMGHLAVAAGNKGIHYSDYFNNLIGATGVNRLREIHLSVPQKVGNIWLDSHRSFSAHLAEEETRTILDLFGRLFWLKMQSREKTPLLINFEFRDEALAPADIQLIVEFVRRILTDK